MSSSGEEDASFYDAHNGGEEEDSDADENRSETREAMTLDDWLEQDAGNAQFTSTPSSPNATRRPKSAAGDSRYRHSLPEPVPAVPAIPEHHLATGKRATLLQRRKGNEARKESPKPLNVALSPAIHIQRPSTAGGEGAKSSPLRSPNLRSPLKKDAIAPARTPPLAGHTRRKSLPALPTKAHRETLARLENRSRGGRGTSMSRLSKGRNEDLFLELANDQQDGARPPSRSERVSSRMSFSGKRRSLPAQTASPSTSELRPRTSGAAFGIRSASRLGNQTSDLQRHVDQYRGIPSRATFQADDAVSVSTRSRTGRPHRYSVMPDRAQLADSSRSPELPQYGRRRPSFGNAPSQSYKTRPSQLSSKPQDTHSESPAESSEPKQSLPDSASAESQDEDTVWDELDDLKSRIKKLELTGKLPPTSGAAVSNETSERPRTATTAPTTIDSSPKHEKQEKKPEPAPEAELEAPEPQDAAAANAVGGATVANIHPTLHSALAKAKPLLNGALYRSLEATAADALQLAAMTGSAGPQGTAYSAAAIINGVTVADRHVRRKADTMCRNLTDLCLALCEGKHEAPSIVSSPVTLSTPAKSSPSIQYPRNRLDPNDGLNRSAGRPMSRLEARRTSILGNNAGSSLGPSPVASGEDMSASEQEGTPSNQRSESSRRFGRAVSRLQTSRMQRHGEVGDDEDPTIRSASRAMTELGRGKPSGPREYHTPPQQRSVSLRDSLAGRRANAGAYEGNRDLARVASMGSDSGGRRRFHDPSTPPVLEEEGSAEDYQPSSQPKRRVMSYAGQYANRRTEKDLPSRATSLHQRRHIVVE